MGFVPAWLPKTDARSCRAGAPKAVKSSRPKSLTMPALLERLNADRLRNRPDFLRAQRGVRKFATGLTLEACPTPQNAAKAGHLRVGFTASRKIGGAVERNRAKRRLRAAAAAVLPLSGRERTDYVLVARPATLIRPFDDLLVDLAVALAAAHLKLSETMTGGRL